MQPQIIIKKPVGFQKPGRFTIFALFIKVQKVQGSDTTGDAQRAKAAHQKLQMCIAG